MLVRVAIPHYYAPSEMSSGYGSCRSDARLQRAVALSRCLGAVLALERGIYEEILDIAQHVILHTPPSTYPSRSLAGVQVDCHLFVQDGCWLQEVVAAFADRVTVHQLQLDNPRKLPHAARSFLIRDSLEKHANLSLYLEDDLIIQDRFYIDKLMWFMMRTNHRYGIMPHRYEFTGDPAHPRLFVDGPIATNAFPAHHQPAESIASGQFWDGQQVYFDIASNPHSGSFALSAEQRQILLKRGVSEEGFVGPLETVATYTLLQYFPVLKPSWASRDFLTLEHGHQSFVYWRKKMKRAEK